MEEYRIKYNIGKEHAEIDNYHYYMANDPIQALIYHYKSIKKNKIDMQTLSVERYCKYAKRWIDESQVLQKDYAKNV